MQTQLTAQASIVSELLAKLGEQPLLGEQQRLTSDAAQLREQAQVRFFVLWVVSDKLLESSVCHAGFMYAFYVYICMTVSQLAIWQSHKLTTAQHRLTYRLCLSCNLRPTHSR